MCAAYSLVVAARSSDGFERDTQALWQEFRRTHDRALRDRLILTYAPLVKFVAGRLGASLPSHVDEQDLVSYGLLGLISAIERFDPDREIKFETYAIVRIKGAIIDEREISKRLRSSSSLEMPTFAAISSSVGTRISVRSSSTIARSISLARERTERGTQSSDRSSSMIAPLIRTIA